MTTIIADRAALLDTMTFASGANEPESGQMCVMEAAAYIAGEPWSDHPQCVSPVIAAFLRSWNDSLPDETRTALLRPLLPLVIGTHTTDADEETRSWIATDWLVRVHTPAWLRLAGLTDHAQALESLARIADATVAGNAQRTIDAARDAARAAAGYAAWYAAGYAAWVAAGDAARDAARVAAGDAARAAAGYAAGYAAWDAAWYAAGDAARDAIAPTVAMLQAAACDLVREMCAVGRVAAEEAVLQSRADAAERIAITPHAGGTDA